MATLHFRILGCGSSPGVPRIGGPTGADWGQCDPTNPKNRRLRCSLLVRQRDAGGETRVLIDTGPDLREQCISAGIDWADAVLYTHGHADHIHGIDDLRLVRFEPPAAGSMFIWMRRRRNACGKALTIASSRRPARLIRRS
jgi:phosphoribosyl 1,2-cyclic phosphate phosphodiesterase